MNRRACLHAGAAMGAMGSLSACTTLAPAQLAGTWAKDLRDTVSGHTWRIWCYRPALPAPPAGFPVLWLLDGNASFALAAQIARNDESRPPPLRPPGTVIMAIGHPHEAAYTQPLRQRDYTPPVPVQGPLSDRGGADLLLDFMLGPMRKHVPSDLPIHPIDHTLFGHSFGGLLVLHAMFSRPTAFARYAAASPSIWWQAPQLMQQADALARQASTPLRLQLRVGAKETPAHASTPARARTQRQRRMIGNAHEMAQRLTAHRSPHLQVDFEILPNLDHGAVMVHALVDALALARSAT